MSEFYYICLYRDCKQPCILDTLQSVSQHPLPQHNFIKFLDFKQTIKAFIPQYLEVNEDFEFCSNNIKKDWGNKIKQFTLQFNEKMDSFRLEVDKVIKNMKEKFGVSQRILDTIQQIQNDNFHELTKNRIGLTLLCDDFQTQKISSRLNSIKQLKESIIKNKQSNSLHYNIPKILAQEEHNLAIQVSSQNDKPKKIKIIQGKRDDRSKSEIFPSSYGEVIDNYQQNEEIQTNQGQQSSISKRINKCLRNEQAIAFEGEQSSTRKIVEGQQSTFSKSINNYPRNEYTIIDEGKYCYEIMNIYSKQLKLSSRKTVNFSGYLQEIGQNLNFTLISLKFSYTLFIMKYLLVQQMLTMM